MLHRKDGALFHLYTDRRDFILHQYPNTNVLLYHTHPLIAAKSIGEKSGAAYDDPDPHRVPDPCIQ